MTQHTGVNALAAEIVATAPNYRRIDHVAIAVRDLDAGIDFYCGILGFGLVRRLSIQGKQTGMISAELEHNGIKFVLVQGTEPESQVSRLIDRYGPGVAHIAMEVEDVAATVRELKARGLRFDTSVIEGPGLVQAFSSRCPNSGISFELIHRSTEHGFLQTNVQQLFEQLESAGAY
jgi:4-hydroxyphenylpyruvate dioxygenase-like putative hemolysin